MNSTPPPPPPLPPSWQGSSGTSNRRIDSKNSEQSLMGTSELIDAIQQQNLDLINKLLEAGEKVNQLTIYGTPLSVAVRANNLQAVQVLLSQPTCDVNCRDYDGEIPFSVSLRKQCLPEICSLLLSKGATMNCLDSVTNISLLATAIDHQQLQVVEEMIARGCDVNLRDLGNLTPLSHACLLSEPEDPQADEDLESCLWTKKQLISLLYRAGADVNSRLGPPFNGHLLHKLVLERSHYALSVLLDLDKDNPSSSTNKLNIDIVNSIEKNTPLHLAIATGNVSILKLLVEHGAKLNESNVFCDTPLSKALKDMLYDQRAAIRLLLTAGADPNFEDTKSASRRKGHCKPLFAAIDNGDKDTVDLLLKHGANLSSCDYEGNCPILPCLANGVSISLLHYIVDKMDQLQIKYDISSYNYLQAAFRWTKHLQYLIDRGLDVNVSDLAGHKIIHTNYVKLYPASLEVILLNGADPDALSVGGDTMLCGCAGLAGYFEVVQLLVQYGADINRVCMAESEVEEGKQEELTPLQKAFIMEYNQEYYNKSKISQFRYLVNCGAVLTPQLSLWKDSFVADRIIVETSEDDSDSESNDNEDDNNELSAYRSNLLSDLEAVFSPLRLAMICRKVIRSHLLLVNSPGQIKCTIQSLPLPNVTKEFLSYLNVPPQYIIR